VVGAQRQPWDTAIKKTFETLLKGLFAHMPNAFRVNAYFCLEPPWLSLRSNQGLKLVNAFSVIYSLRPK
jgi:hypothetical protein